MVDAPWEDLRRITEQQEAEDRWSSEGGSCLCEIHPEVCQPDACNSKPQPPEENQC